MKRFIVYVNLLILAFKSRSCIKCLVLIKVRSYAHHVTTVLLSIITMNFVAIKKKTIKDFDRSPMPFYASFFFKFKYLNLMIC